MTCLMYFLLFFLGGLATPFMLNPTPSQVAVSPTIQAPIEVAVEPTIQAPEERFEVYDVFDYAEGIFEPELWRVAGMEELPTTTFTYWRLREQEDVIVFFLYIHYDMGVTEEGINEYFSEEGFDVLLANYIPYTRSAECRVGDLRLYEFTSSSDNVKRLLRYWVDPVSDTRVMGVNAIAPTTHLRLLNDYSARLFPELPSCEAVEE